MKAIPYGKQNIEQDGIDTVVETPTIDFFTQGQKLKDIEYTSDKSKQLNVTELKELFYVTDLNKEL